MCGITGIIHPNASQGLIAAMTDVMFARGPDGAGYYIDNGIAMGMRRLSIIDLEHGWQPLYSAGQTIVAFQNGEIYNHVSLRSDLQKVGYEFKTLSDTEVLAHGYHCWGLMGLANRLDGMYAVAILDKRRRILHLIRDRLGEKPLFIASFENGFAYASDMSILAALPGVDKDISLDGLNDYLALHYVPGRKTILNGVQRVLPGEVVTIGLEKLECNFERYYFPPIGEYQKISDDELAERIETAVVSRLVSDVPVGVFLSGGLDSSIVASIAASKIKGIATFSMGFHSAEYDESEFARKLATHIGSQHHHFMFDEQSFIDLLPKVANVLDEPVGDQALLPMFWLCHEASNHVKVVLAGEGADEVFAGYGYYSQFSESPTLKDRLRLLLGRRGRPTCDRFIRNAIPMTPSGFPLLTDVAGRDAVIGSHGVYPSVWEQHLIDWLDSAADPLQRATCTDLLTWLPDNLLVKFDRMAMAHSLEGRAPFLDPLVVQAGITGLCPKQRMAGKSSKVALRRVAQRWVPEDILKRRKQGFVLPMQMWISNWVLEHGDMEEYFSSIPAGGDSMEKVGVLLRESVGKSPSRERLNFSCILLGEWARSFYLRTDFLSRKLSRFLAA